MKIMLTGANGQVGWELARSLGSLGHLIPLSRAECDLSQPEHVRAAFGKLKPDLVVNAAAYTAVDQAETEQEQAELVNSTSVQVLAEEVRRSGSFLLHFSTDYVFDGTKSAPYTETDAVCPLNVYGKTKRDGEMAIFESGCDHLILRTSWVYGLRQNNFLLKILALAKSREELQVVDDQIGSPTWSRSLAEATSQIVSRGLPELRKNIGIYHASSSGEASWYNFACEILDKCSELVPLKCRRITPVPSSSFPTTAQRPSYSRLDCNKLQERFGIRLPQWQTSFDTCSRDLAEAIALNRKLSAS